MLFRKWPLLVRKTVQRGPRPKPGLKLMPFDWTQMMGVVVVLFGAAFMYLQIRHRPQATRDVKTGADLQRRISNNSYTLVQLFAPM